MSKQNWASEYLQMIKDCEDRESKLTEWEVGFLESISTQLAQAKAPSAKQIDKLNDIWERVTSGGKGMDVTVDNGKYRVIQDANGRLRALRHGEEWRDCCGDNLIYALAAEVERLREALGVIQQVASGGAQVADDDTAGMAWIDNCARAALTGEN